MSLNIALDSVLDYECDTKVKVSVRYCVTCVRGHVRGYVFTGVLLTADCFAGVHEMGRIDV